jgi:preprotein translocase subunit SecG
MTIINAIQILLGLLLSGVILMQQQGAGLGGAFGGEGNVYRSRRGIEKFLFYATIVLALAFFILALVTVHNNPS